MPIIREPETKVRRSQAAAAASEPEADQQIAELLPCQEYEPEYTCWHEKEFMADRTVVRMTPLQRLMYRSLVQAALYCSTRPYLPDHDGELAAMADAPDDETWLANRDAILKKFYKVTFADETYWAHKRLVADFRQMLAAERKKGRDWHSKQAARSAAASKAADTRWHKGDRCDVDAVACEAHGGMRGDALNKTETERKLKPKESKTETENKRPSGSVVPVIGTNSVGVGSGALRARAGCLLELWASTHPDTDLFDENASSPFNELLSRGEPDSEIEAVLKWLPKSNHWDKPGKGELAGPAGFVRAYAKIREHYEKYRGKIIARSREEKAHFEDEDEDFGSV